MDDADILSRTSLFSMMKKGDLRRIAKGASRHYYTKGEVIMREGDRDGRLFVILSGRVKVIKNLGTEGERVLQEFRANHFFGEMAVLDDHVRTASVTAEEDAEILSLDQWNLREALEKYPYIAIELLQTLARRVRAAEARITD